MLLARAAVDMALLRLAWPRGCPRPAWAALLSCMALTLLAWVLLSPAVTLTFGAAVLPFSWPFLAALPIMLGIAAALSHGGVIAGLVAAVPATALRVLAAWQLPRRSAGAAVIARLGTAAALGVAAVAGMVNARAWYGIAVIAARCSRGRRVGARQVVFGLPFAPIAALMVLALVVGVARMMFTGTIQLPIGAPSRGRGDTLSGGTARRRDGCRPGHPRDRHGGRGRGGPGRSAGARPAVTPPTACTRAAGPDAPVLLRGPERERPPYPRRRARPPTTCRCLRSATASPPR